MRSMQYQFGVLGTISAFAYRQTQGNQENLCRDGWSHGLPDTDFQPAVRRLQYIGQQGTQFMQDPIQLARIRIVKAKLYPVSKIVSPQVQHTNCKVTLTFLHFYSTFIAIKMKPRLSPSLHYSSLHFALLHLTSLHITSFHFTTLRFTSLHIISLHFNSHHFTSLHSTSLHFTSLHNTVLHITAFPIFHFRPPLEVSSPHFKKHSLLITYNHFTKPIYKNMCFAGESRQCSAGSWRHSSIVLFTQQYLPISVLCLLTLIL